MELVVVVVALFVLLAILWIAARNATTICVLEIDRGKVAMTRGAIIQRVLTDIGDVVRRPKVTRATVRIVRSRGHAVLEMKGDLSDAQKQQLRNVVGSIPLAKLVNARRKK